MSIIKFYNEIFLPNVKSLLEEIGSKQVPDSDNGNTGLFTLTFCLYFYISLHYFCKQSQFVLVR